MNQNLCPNPIASRSAASVCLAVSNIALLLLLAGCVNPMGADRSTPRMVFRQLHDNAVNVGQPSQATREVLFRFDLVSRFEEAPDSALQVLHDQAVATGEPDLVYALSELNYLRGERLRHKVRPWEPGDPRDYYLASAVYAWFYLFEGSTNSQADVFDDRFRAACSLYNHGLGYALGDLPGTNGIVKLQGGTRRLPVGQIDVEFIPPPTNSALTRARSFLLADRFLARGLSVRNRQSGLGAPLIAVGKFDGQVNLSRGMPATVLLRIEGGLTGLSSNQWRASLEVYSPFEKSMVQVNNRSVPLETDTTIPLAYALNQSAVWDLGRVQFLSGLEQVPSDIYSTRPYQTGRIPVVFVHGTFSSPIWWAEMINTLSADPELNEHFQLWFFIYNSGNPIPYSAGRLREALTKKIKELDPEGKDAALQQMVVIGHSQGGLLAKLTATDTGDKLWRVVNTNRVEDLPISEAQKAVIRKTMFYKPLPFVKRLVFISTPHRGSFKIGGLVLSLSHRLITLPNQILKQSSTLAVLTEKLNLPKQLRRTPTSLDSMSPKNPFLLAAAAIPPAPGVKAHSIIAIETSGDYHKGNDGVVSYKSAHVDYVESEFIVHSFHSCQDNPATIKEVRRILKEHLASLSASSTNPPPLNPANP